MRDITPGGPDHRSRPPHDIQDTVRTSTDPAAAPPSPPSRFPVKGLVRTAVIGAVGVAIVSGAVGSVGTGEPTTVATDKIASRVTIDAGSSDVRVVDGGSGNVEFDLPTRFGRPAADVDQSWSGSNLGLDVSCTAFLGCRSDVVVRVPRGAAVEVRSSSGDLTLDGIRGESSVEASSGDVVLRDVERATVRTSSGDVDLDNVGVVDARTTSGDIEGRADGRDVSARTSSGEVELELPQVRRADIETSSGDVELELDGGRGYDIDADSSTGDIEVDDIRDEDGSADRLTIRTSSGDIELRD